MLQVLNSISVLSAFLFFTGIIYLFLDATVGRVKIFHSRFEWHGFQIKDVVFIFLALIILFEYTAFIEPY